MKVINEWEKKWKKDMNFWFSKAGKELQLDAVAQGYEVNLFNIMFVLFGSYFSAYEIIRELKKETMEVKRK